MNAWKNVLGASGQGIEFYGDADGSFTNFMQKVGENSDLIF
jgi:peroxiredoxin